MSEQTAEYPGVSKTEAVSVGEASPRYAAGDQRGHLMGPSASLPPLAVQQLNASEVLVKAVALAALVGSEPAVVDAVVGAGVVAVASELAPVGAEVLQEEVTPTEDLPRIAGLSGESVSIAG